ncbi:hypothetical protein DSL72_003720 [Monilinia vaccinii-corymbosi]|uniref:SMP-30/Gluconolactonase/LRE-like region domain-containing protein n=1 Tax=Monilinia vaccinii-corymbosi TaxID=61207 RepID=A0A8A3P877_9HELO|nr:hypothetical protein DSL72_003720 [Monilinia vaccinii-corymbosi]
MQSLFYSVGLLATIILSIANAKPLAKPSAPSLPLAVTELRSFGDKTWAENIAVRSNGQLLVTRLDSPILQLLDPTNKTAPITLHTFNTTTYIGLLGITEIVPKSDIFYVALQTPYTPVFTKTTNYSNAIFKVDLNTFSSKAGSLTSNPRVSHTIDIPESVFLNGIDTLDPEHILITDSTLGHVYNLDISTISYTTPLKLASMAIPPDAVAQLGINGIHYRPPYLYFDNLGASTLNRVPIAPTTALPTGDGELLVSVPNPDDFVIREDGTIFICGNAQDTLFMWKEGMSEVVAVAGSNTSTILAGVTAGAFERVRGREGKRLWLTTSGAQAQPINGTIITGATVLYVDTEGI